MYKNKILALSCVALLSSNIAFGAKDESKTKNQKLKIANVLDVKDLQGEDLTKAIKKLEEFEKKLKEVQEYKIDFLKCVKVILNDQKDQNSAFPKIVKAELNGEFEDGMKDIKVQKDNLVIGITSDDKERKLSQINLDKAQRNAINIATSEAGSKTQEDYIQSVMSPESVQCLSKFFTFKKQ